MRLKRTEMIPNTAVIAIDLHRGHLDPAVATMPLPDSLCKKVIESNQHFFNSCRERSLPIIHLLTKYRNQQEILSNPAWYARANDPGATRRNVAEHNLQGMPGVEIIPELLSENDVVIDTKKRYDCFIGTDLEFVLRAMDIRALWITGVNTNSCVLATSIAASVRDFKVTIVSDCVDTMDGEKFHDSALQIFERAFGEVAEAKNLIQL